MGGSLAESPTASAPNSYDPGAVALACDLACHHCGSRAGRARPDELTTAEALDLVDQLAALGANEVTLIGGEAYVGGNVREHPLVDLWERSRPLRFTRDLTVQDLKGFCATCYYAQECRGGCHWTSHVLLGDRGDNPFCHHRALELMREGVRERVRCVDAAPGLSFDHARYEVYREPWPDSERAAIERLHAEVEAETCALDR